jgi:DNA-binding transcriptional regulator LsrR (DeoR family)
MRLLVKVARMYHERGLRQPEIAAHLNMSQPRVSRLLKEAADRGVVRTVVAAIRGVYAGAGSTSSSPTSRWPARC